MSVEPDRHDFVFVGGLHKSGTSLLAACIGEHPDVSSFRNTGFPEDEGQHLQTVFPSASAFGGAGRFGFRPEARLTESSPLVSRTNRERLLAEWMPHWDRNRRVLMEKSPPNLIRTRFLQALFPRSAFVMILRDPIAVSYATRKWSRTPLASLIEHWIVCHEIFEEDRTHLGRVHVVRYEHLVEDPRGALDGIFSFLGLEPHPTTMAVRNDSNAAYLSRWKKMAKIPERERDDTVRVITEYGPRAAAFGYELTLPG